ncbi:unnamed protein product [Discula destructiva]
MDPVVRARRVVGTRRHHRCGEAAWALAGHGVGSVDVKWAEHQSYSCYVKTAALMSLGSSPDGRESVGGGVAAEYYVLQLGSREFGVVVGRGNPEHYVERFDSVVSTLLGMEPDDAQKDGLPSPQEGVGDERRPPGDEVAETHERTTVFDVEARAEEGPEDDVVAAARAWWNL